MAIPSVIKKLLLGPLAPIGSCAFNIVAGMQYKHFEKKWLREGAKLPDQEEIDFVVKNVTIMYKSFERQKLAERLYNNIQKYYPGVHVVIADDSSRPLNIQGDYVEIIQLPFNSGLCNGLNQALERVKTPYVMRMDDDELLTVKTTIAEQVRFLKKTPVVDIVGFCTLTAPDCKDPAKEAFRQFWFQNMSYAPKKLLVPHGAAFDKEHIVFGKIPNLYVARTESVRKIGWDNNIRMMDHNDFFMRAAGACVTVLALDTAVFHYHNPFDKGYQKYRRDVEKDREYLDDKWGFK